MGSWDYSWNLFQAVVPLENQDMERCIVTGKRYSYSIYPGKTTIVFSKKGDTVLGAACVLLPGYPGYDKVVAEYLLIKNDEERYLRTANLSFDPPKARQWIPMLIMLVGGAGIILALLKLAFLAFHR